MQNQKQYTWLVRQEMDWQGGIEYSIEIKELPGCVSYGDTYKQAKEGLIEAVTLWKEKRKISQLRIPNEGSDNINIQSAMTLKEFEDINAIIREWK
ncbi:type II toxin-antitoxin system HicB family antitoxin [Alkalihalobacterium bogoriense]|uniref:type II toxin-antitoxin system HicB family antitoxin n=1 Tax=Alkalihalobacterium bogoriense TaxID=246272 RepID=UPI00047B064E|nr:type II toxin-antitoxin system HicB family antitoxin [Alkalihalobacterium bogoriense]